MAVCDFRIETAIDLLVARAWTNTDFYQRLVSDTSQVLKEAGLAISAIVCTEGTATPGLCLGSNGGYEIVLSAPPTLGDEVLYSYSKKAGLTPMRCAQVAPPSCVD